MCMGNIVSNLCFFPLFPGLNSGSAGAFRIYTGQAKGDMPVSSNLVIESGLFGKGYEVHANNWYTSPCLFYYLQNRRVNAVGTAYAKRPAGKGLMLIWTFVAQRQACCAINCTTEGPLQCCRRFTIHSLWFTHFHPLWRWMTGWLSHTSPLTSRSSGILKSCTNWLK